MFEVYAGFKPGRPALLIVMSGLLLIGSIGAAYLQTLQKRALAPERRIGDTPLYVRPPLGWTEIPGEPGLFELFDRSSAPLPIQQRPAERSLRITYRRYEAFVPPDELLNTESSLVARDIAVHASTIGGVPAIEVRRIVAFVHRGVSYARESILRAASTPRGDTILVEYDPQTDATPADQQLLDAVCASIRIDDGGAAHGATDASGVFERAGMSFETPGDCAVLLQDEGAYPAIGVVGIEDGVPAFAVMVRRTWLAMERTPADLLRDFVDLIWREPREYSYITQWSRLDGGSVASLIRGDLGDAPQRRSAANVVAIDADRAAFVVCVAEARRMAAARQVAAQIAGSLKINATAGGFDAASATKRGEELVRELESKGAVPWWGSARVSTQLLAADPPRAAVIRRRTPTDNGYVGADGVLYGRNRAYRVARWRLDSRARSYEIAFAEGEAAALTSVPTRSVRESREADGSITREIQLASGARYQTTLQPGPAFVAPPAELAAMMFLKHRGSGDWLIQCSSLSSGALCSRLLQALPPDDAGNPRVRVLADFQPRGEVFTFLARDEEIDSIHAGGGAFSFRRATEGMPGSDLLRRLRDILGN